MNDLLPFLVTLAATSWWSIFFAIIIIYDQVSMLSKLWMVNDRFLQLRLRRHDGIFFYFYYFWPGCDVKQTVNDKLLFLVTLAVVVLMAWLFKIYSSVIRFWCKTNHKWYISFSCNLGSVDLMARIFFFRVYFYFSCLLSMLSKLWMINYCCL